ncbi:MAG: amidohydrolase family protein [Gemmatimonadota bacterium]
MTMAAATLALVAPPVALSQPIAVPATAQPALAQDNLSSSTVAFVDVTVVPMDRRVELPNHTVLVRDGVIDRVGPSAEIEIPDDARPIDGRGRWLAPGLVDTHVHLFSSWDLHLYLANGVTTIVNLGGYGAADSILHIRREIEEGRVSGPTIYTSGNWLDGEPAVRPFNTVLRTEREARAEVRRQDRAGFDFLKVYATLERHVYAAILDEAERVGIPVTGHIPARVGVQAVLEGNQSWIAHAAGIALRTVGPNAGNDELRRLAERVREADVTVTTTLWMTELALRQRTGPAAIADVASRPEMRYLPPGRRAAWRDDNMYASYPGISASEAEARIAFARRWLDVLSSFDVPLLAGTDADVAGSVPGFAMHEELRVLTEAGLTPYRALRTATTDAGAYLGSILGEQPPFGTIEPGARADLVLLDADPLKDVSSLRRPAGVMVRGEWLDDGELENMLGDAAR